ncbi:MAG: deoxyribonuclease IV [Bacilli bacterium]
MNDEILIGSHIGMGSPDFFLGTCEKAISFNENTFMFYTGAPQNSVRVPLEKCKIKEGLELLKKNNIDITNCIVHAPYIINLANSIDENKFLASEEILKNELKRTFAFGTKILVLHPGSHVGAGEKAGLDQLILGLNDVLKVDTTDVVIAIETMAGKGNEIGSSFENIAYILNNCKYQNRLGVCLDTCHINDAGYDVFDEDNVINEFDRIIGLQNLKVMHINDSKNPRSSHKDRHENYGFGEIGYETLNKFVFDKRLINIPKILETPYVGSIPPYKEEIAMIKSGIFDPELRNKLLKESIKN